MFDKLKHKINYIFNFFNLKFLELKNNFPKVLNTDEAIKSLKEYNFDGFNNVENYLRNPLFVNNKNITNYKDISYIGKVLSADYEEIFDEANKVITNIFDSPSSPIIAIYHNQGYEFFYWYHNGLNGHGNFADYMDDANDKLRKLQKATGYADICDIYNDMTDDVADWLFVFRVE